jgi:hypothetical protein
LSRLLSSPLSKRMPPGGSWEDIVTESEGGMDEFG